MITANSHLLPRLIGGSLVYNISIGFAFGIIVLPFLVIALSKGLSVEQVRLFFGAYPYVGIALSVPLYVIVFIFFARWCLFPLFIVDKESLENKSLNQSSTITHGNTIRTAIFAALAYYFPPFGMMALVVLYRWLLKHNGALLDKPLMFMKNDNHGL